MSFAPPPRVPRPPPAPFAPPNPPSPPRPPAPKPPAPPPRRPPPPAAVDDSIKWPGAVVITFTAIAFVVMAMEWAGPDLVFSGLLAFFVAFGSDFETGKARIISVSQASAGYGNSGLLTVMFLYLMAEGITQTGGLEYLMSYVLGRSRSTHWAIVRSTLPVAFVSAFLNNTPIVSIMTPILISWGRRNGVPIKKLLIPLSYAAVLGGTCTLIGTSTNLVISAQQERRYTAQQVAEAKFRLFDIAPWGVPYALWGMIFVILTQRFLLPGNVSRYAKNLLLALRINPGSSLPGKTTESSGFGKLAGGVKVAGVLRKGAFISAPPLDFVFDRNDVLYFSGELNEIEYIGEENGLGLVTQEAEEQLDNPEPNTPVFNTYGAAPYSRLHRLIVKKDSELVGRKIKEVQFRNRFGVTVVALKRSVKRPDSTLGDTIIEAGEVLLVDVDATTFDPKAPRIADHFDGVVPVKDGAAKEFIIAVRVKKGPGDVVGKTLSQAGLRGIPGLHPMGVDRDNGEHVEASDYTLKLEVGDTIWFAADLHAVTFLNKFIGLELVQQEQVDKTSTSIIYRQFAQAAVNGHGALVGKSIRDLRFRTRYNAAVVAVHREGVRVPLKVPDIVLQANDVLLLSCDVNWCEEHRHDKAFVLIKDVPDSSPPKRKGMVTASLLVIGLVLTQIIGGIKEREYIHLWPCAVLVGILMLLFGCMSGDQARRSFLWDVYLTIAAAFGISQCMENTFVAKNFAELFISIGKSAGSSGAALVAIYLATALMSEILTNNAAGAIMYPIAAIAGDNLRLKPKDVSVAIMLGGSAGFINPYSYQCNLMVYAAGNYSFKEFATIGAPFQVYLAIVSGFILCLRDKWHQQWIFSWCIYAGVVILPGLWTLIPARYTHRWALWWSRTFSRGSAKRAASLDSDSTDSPGSSKLEIYHNKA